MKTTTTLLLAFFFTAAYGQTNDYQVLLDSAKNLFKAAEQLRPEDKDTVDYGRIVRLLEQAIDLNADNAEARYFLGYTYARMNLNNPEAMPSRRLDLLYKASEQLEKVIQQTPKYMGEQVILDPYAKITAEWGSSAMGYWANNRLDSAVWAFQEGKKRGGFSPFLLGIAKNILDACDPNAILLSSGDNISFPLWYWQIVEQYRTDVSVVEVNLLNTRWYPARLLQDQSVPFDLPKEELDTISYIEWASTEMTINGFTWELGPSYYQYLLRGNRILLSILKANQFKRPVYFALGFAEEGRLSLTEEQLSDQVWVNEFLAKNPADLSYARYKKVISKVLKLSDQVNLNSQDEHLLLDRLRYSPLERALNYLKTDPKKAKELINLLDKYVDKEKYPYYHEGLQQYDDYVRQLL